MDNEQRVRQFWKIFSNGDYPNCKQLFIEKPRIIWPTSREYYDDISSFIEVNEVFGRDWNFEIQELEMCSNNADKVISIIRATSPSFVDNFFATSVFKFEEGLISEMQTYWAIEDVQPDFRKGISKVY